VPLTTWAWSLRMKRCDHSPRLIMQLVALSSHGLTGDRKESTASCGLDDAEPSRNILLPGTVAASGPILLMVGKE
jgi:hypothetical protein